MENKQIDIENLTQDDFLELAKYTHHLEQTNAKLLSELEQAKAYLTATIQQRNSAETRLRQCMEYKANTIDVTAAKTETLITNIELVNPEQYREKKNQR